MKYKKSLFKRRQFKKKIKGYETLSHRKRQGKKPSIGTLYYSEIQFLFYLKYLFDNFF